MVAKITTEFEIELENNIDPLAKKCILTVWKSGFERMNKGG